MRAIKIHVGEASFLLPDSHQFYEFPSYIVQHKEKILQHVTASKKFVNDPLTDHTADLPDLSEFKRITGIIGYPFNIHDVDLYVLDRKVHVTLEVRI